MITINNFNLACTANSWKRVGDTHPVDLYYGKDENGNYAIEFSGRFKINKRVLSSEYIKISIFINKNGTKSTVFSLLDNRVLKLFCDFLNTLIEATKDHLTNQEAYNVICDVYLILQKMYRPLSDVLTENEIKGLIGELLFLRDELIPKYGTTAAINAWTGCEKTRKDFSIDNHWHEIKTIDFGKDTVHISSIEQLDSPVNGTLVIIQLEKMAVEFNGVTLNNVVASIFKLISTMYDRDVFTSKLVAAKYSYNTIYDEYVYEMRGFDYYLVDEKFPRISRSNISDAISKASFDLIIAELITYKQ